MTNPHISEPDDITWIPKKILPNEKSHYASQFCGWKCYMIVPGTALLACRGPTIGRLAAAAKQQQQQQQQL